MRVYTDGELDVVWVEDELRVRRGTTTRRFSGVPRNLPFELFAETSLLILPSGREAWLSTPLAMHPEWGSAIVVCDLAAGAITHIEPAEELARLGDGLLAAGSRTSLDRVNRRLVRAPYLALRRLVGDRLEATSPPSLAFPAPGRAAWPTHGAGAIWKTLPWSDAPLTGLRAPRVTFAGGCAIEEEAGLVVRLDPDGAIDVLRVPKDEGTETRISAIATSRGVLVTNDSGKGPSALCHFELRGPERAGGFLGALTWDGLTSEPCLLEGDRLLLAHEMNDFTSRLRLWLVDLAQMRTLDEHVTELRATNGYPTLSAARDGARWLLGDGIQTLAGAIVRDRIVPEGP